jgi:hypothetical protein
VSVKSVTTVTTLSPLFESVLSTVVLITSHLSHLSPPKIIMGAPFARSQAGARICLRRCNAVGACFSDAGAIVFGGDSGDRWDVADFIMKSRVTTLFLRVVTVVTKPSRTEEHRGAMENGKHARFGEFSGMAGARRATP